MVDYNNRRMPEGVPPVSLRIPYPVLTYYIFHAAGGIPYAVYRPTRVGIHIAWLYEKRGVG
jgi:hypothetical protein